MNRLRLRTYVSEYGDRTVQFFVDDADLRDLVRASELEMGADASIAGEYDGPQAAVVEASSRHLLGEPASDWVSSGEIPGTVLLLGCTCGTGGCWPLHVRIEVQGQMVRWSGFANPFRPNWTYVGLGPFEFELQSYVRELQSLSLSGPRGT